MAFKDYSLTPDDNTALGDGTYIGPNMLRNKVRPALQQIAADGRELYDEVVARGAGGVLPAFIAAGTDAVERTVQAKLRDTVSVNDFGAVGDGTTNDTVAINKAILAVALRGGGEVTFGASASGYKVLGPVIIPPNVIVNLSGQTLTGTAFSAGETMFISGTVEAGVLTSNLASAADTKIVGYAGVRNGQIKNCSIAFHLRNFNFGTYINDIQCLNVLQTLISERCFYMSMDNVSNRGSSDAALPTFHFKEANNLINLRRISATTASPFKFEGGSTGVTMASCSGEGGVGTGIAFVGDCLGFTIEAGYWEGLQGTLFDFTAAGVCSVNFKSNYINLVETVFNDGGGGAVATIFGSFDASNYRAGIGTVDTGFTYHSYMKVSGARNFVDFELPYANDSTGPLPSEWTVGKNTRLSQRSGATGASLTDIRARAELFPAGIVPVAMSGDVGTSFANTVPFTAVTYPTGGSVTATIDTKAAWKVDELFGKFRFTVTDDSSTYKIFGDTFGDVVKQHDTSGKTVSISNNGGFLRISIAGLANVAGNRTITGRFQIVR